MKAARRDFSRVYDWSAVKGDNKALMVSSIVRFVDGLHKARTVLVSKKQIVDWFKGTPAEFVEQGISDALSEGLIRCCANTLGSHMRSNGSYVYEVVNSRYATSEVE